jgi:hypothetical protein
MIEGGDSTVDVKYAMTGDPVQCPNCVSHSGISEEVKTQLELSCKRLLISRW